MSNLLDRPDIKALATPAMLERGCVHVIGLEPLRDEAGARWEKIRASVHTKLEAILRQKLGPSDFFAPLNDVSYLVTMPSASRDDAQVSCLRVTHDLYTNYLGQFDPARISFYAAAQGDEDTLVLESLSKERINLLVEKAGIDERKEPSRDERDAGLAAAPRKDETALDVRPQFWPIWDARNEAVTSYLCLPETIAFAHAPLEPVALQDLKPKERAYVDLCCLRSGVAALAKHLERGERFLMTLRVSFETLAAPITRMDFANACRELPSDYRQYLVFELADVPDGVPQSRLADLATALRPYAKAIRAYIPSGCRALSVYQGIGLQAICLDLSRLRLKSKELGGDEISRISNAARRMSLPMVIGGISDVAALKMAHESGAHFLTGRAVSLPLADPAPMKRFPWRELVQASMLNQRVA